MGVNYVSKEGLNHYSEQLKSKMDGLYVKQEAGKQLSTEDFTTAEKTKLDNLDIQAITAEQIESLFAE